MLRDNEYVEMCTLPDGECSCPGPAPDSEKDPEVIAERIHAFALDDVLTIGLVTEHACNACNPGDGIICAAHSEMDG